MTPASRREGLADAMAAGLTRIVIDGTARGVTGLPAEWHVAEVPLNLSWRFKEPISLDEDAIRARLSFGGVTHNLVIPWAAVLSIDYAVAAEVGVRPKPVRGLHLIRGGRP